MAQRAKKKKQQRGPHTTVVPDRSTMPLGSEAKLIAGFLRGVGADGARAVRPGINSDEKRKAWLLSESRLAKRVPMWMLDYGVAILEQIPDRKDRPRGRRREDGTARAELLSQGNITTADAARWVAEMEAAGTGGTSGERLSGDAIAARAEKIARRVYRRRKHDVPNRK